MFWLLAAMCITLFVARNGKTVWRRAEIGEEDIRSSQALIASFGELKKGTQGVPCQDLCALGGVGGESKGFVEGT